MDLFCSILTTKTLSNPPLVKGHSGRSGKALPLAVVTMRVKGFYGKSLSARINSLKAKAKKNMPITEGGGWGTKRVPSNKMQSSLKEMIS